MIRIIVADGHPIVWQGLRSLLKRERDLELVGETENGGSAVCLAERLKPNVLIIDLALSSMDGLEVIRQVRQRSPGTQVLIFSASTSEKVVIRALRNGALGYVLKSGSCSDLIKAVRLVANGHRYLSPPLCVGALQAYLEGTDQSWSDPYETLTAREREVLALWVQGIDNAAIADRLFISPRTAEHHRENAKRKLGLRNHTELIRFALRQGLLPLDG